jgi:hypothetical protein
VFSNERRCFATAGLEDLLVAATVPVFAPGNADKAVFHPLSGQLCRHSGWLLERYISVRFAVH